jgi:hypothetical protein
MEDLIWRSLRADYSIDANDPEVEELVAKRSVAQESEADIDWDAAIGFNLFGGKEANNSANGPAEGDEAEKSDNPSDDEHQQEGSDHSGSSEENKHTFQSDNDEDE